jgi:predicted nuclease of predicted toxin-antitoxin system
MRWAHENGYIVLTHDLDFGVLLALTQAVGPSVLQVRAQDVTPSHLEAVLVKTLRQHQEVLRTGALISMDETGARVRILPFGDRKNPED